MDEVRNKIIVKQVPSWHESQENKFIYLYPASVYVSSDVSVRGTCLRGLG